MSDVQGNLAFDFVFPVGASYEVTTVIDIFYTSEYNASATFDPGLLQGGYSRYNARVGLGPDTGSWEIALLGKNLSDERVLSFGGDTPLAGSTFGAKSNYAFYTQGRTLALQGTVRF